MITLLKTTFLCLLFVPLSLIILNIWLWIFYNIFNIDHTKNRLKIITIIIWVFSGLSIVFYPKIVSLIWFGGLDFTNFSNNWNFEVIFFFWLYLSLIIFAVKIAISKFKISNFFLLNFFSFSWIFLLWGFFGSKFLTQWAILYYIFVAFGEEFAKYLLGLNFYEKRKISNNDIIIFSIISAIGFAFVENIVYLLPITQKTITASIIWWTWILVTRGIVWFIVHILFTWNIWLFSLKKLNSKKNIFLLLGILIWVWLHYCYNVFLHLNFQFVIIFAVLIWYFWISYIFYQSNSIYASNWLEGF